MNIQEAYNLWAEQYDTNANKTRDLESRALREVLSSEHFDRVLEIGCGTGKNTSHLIERSGHVTAIDFSEEMLRKAKEKYAEEHVEFRNLDIRNPWNFSEQTFDLVTCSLILEHIQDLEFVFRQVNYVLHTGGSFYIGELHPFKQYSGSKARFEFENKIVSPECFIHHFSDFFQAAKINQFNCIRADEWFDENDRATTPRLLTLVFKKIA